MKPIINHLVQLQELMEARAQQEAVVSNPQFAELDASIEALKKKLPPDIFSKFMKLQQKSHVAIVPIANGRCSACAMQLPISLVQIVAASAKVTTCPTCARILFMPSETLPQRISSRTKRFEVPKVGIARFTSPNLMMPQIEAATRDEAIEEIAMKLQAEQFVDDGIKLRDAAIAREAIISTAVEHGIAFPHVRGIEGGGLTLALATSKKGIRCESSGKNLTRIIFFMLIPTGASAFYLKLLAGLTGSFQKKENRDKLLDADTPEKLWKALTSTTRTTVK
ncbi:MAG: PTS sugar transporter subunit IIA [Kiritimatiellia bacterium]